MSEVVNPSVKSKEFVARNLKSIQLCCIIEETIRSRAFNKRIRTEAFQRGTNDFSSIPLDQHKPQKKSFSDQHNPHCSSQPSDNLAPSLSTSLAPSPPIPSDSSNLNPYYVLHHSSCDRCSALPPSEHCIFELMVKRRTNIKDLHGSLITCAPANDRVLLSKVSVHCHIIISVQTVLNSL
jgi:hypothetical protein